MGHPNRWSKRSEWTTASQLAEMGFCERKVLLKHVLGPRESISRQAAQRAGSEEHHHFLRAAFREQPTVVSSLMSPGVSCPRRTASLWARMLDFIGRLFLS